MGYVVSMSNTLRVILVICCVCSYTQVVTCSQFVMADNTLSQFVMADNTLSSGFKWEYKIEFAFPEKEPTIGISYTGPVVHTGCVYRVDKTDAWRWDISIVYGIGREQRFHWILDTEESHLIWGLLMGIYEANWVTHQLNLKHDTGAKYTTRIDVVPSMASKYRSKWCIASNKPMIFLDHYGVESGERYAGVGVFLTVICGLTSDAKQNNIDVLRHAYTRSSEDRSVIAQQRISVGHNDGLANYHYVIRQPTPRDLVYDTAQELLASISLFDFLAPGEILFAWQQMSGQWILDGISPNSTNYAFAKFMLDHTNIYSMQIVTDDQSYIVLGNPLFVHKETQHCVFSDSVDVLRMILSESKRENPFVRDNQACSVQIRYTTQSTNCEVLIVRGELFGLKPEGDPRGVSTIRIDPQTSREKLYELSDVHVFSILV